MPSLAVAGTGKTLERMWQECQTETVSTVAQRNGLTRQQLVALFQQSGHLGGGNRDPSRAEIRQACQALKRRWSEEQAKSRYVGARLIRRG